MTKRNPNPLRWMCLASAAVLLPGMAQALPSDDDYLYGGIGIGQARARIDNARIADTLLTNRGLATTSIRGDERDTTYKLFGGYQFNRYVGMELGYFRLGRFAFDAVTEPPGALNAGFRVEGANFDLVGTLPITDNFSLLARAGVQRARTRLILNGTGAVVVSAPTAKDTQTDAKLGLGMQYAFSRSLMVRADVERFRISDALGNKPRIATYSVSLVFPLGRDAPTPRSSVSSYTAPREVVPMPVAPVQAMVQPPPPPPVPMPTPIRSVSYSAESLFGFDASKLRPEGMAALDQFARELEGSSYEEVSVQGHTDRIGTVQYNQVLSLQRADAVKSYLVGSSGLESARITTQGRGESQPITVADACKGSVSAPLIECLQPDRRVEITVTGKR